jgi:Na+-transporting methylmalonyl-CoA/oxaloacetate decarboxylase gamma subunit
MSALLQRFTPIKETQPALSANAPVQQDEQLIAVISAAVHKYRSRHKP